MIYLYVSTWTMFLTLWTMKRCDCCLRWQHHTCGSFGNHQINESNDQSEKPILTHNWSQLLQILSHAGQNYWMLIGWDRGHVFLITRALLVIKRAWLLDADWLSTSAVSLFPASNGFVWKGMSETHHFWVWSKHGYFILTWKKINMQQSAVFWWKPKGFFRKKCIDWQPEKRLSG